MATDFSVPAAAAATVPATGPAAQVVSTPVTQPVVEQAATPGIDWTTITDEQFQQSPHYSKLHSGMRKAEAKLKADYERQLQATKAELAAYQRALQGNPEVADIAQQAQLTARSAAMEAELGGITQERQRQEAIQQIAKQYGVDASLIETAETPFEAYDRIIQANTLKATAQQTEFEKLSKRMAALEAARTDPVANPQALSGAPNDLQAQYNDLIKKKEGGKAEAIYRQALADGITIDPLQWRTK